MRKQLILWVIALSVEIVFSTQSTAYGQWYVGGAGGNGTAYGNLGRAAGYGYGLGFGGASDPISSYTAASYNGMSNLVRSQGAYNVATSQAMINYQQARSQYIDNEQKAYAARQTHLRMVQAENARKKEEAHESLARAEDFMASHRPSPLAHEQLDPSTGAIHWPVALATPDFEESRKALDTLFAKKAQSGPSSELSSQIEKKTGELKDSLRSHIVKIALTDYSEARKFLDSMAVSAR